MVSAMRRLPGKDAAKEAAPRPRTRKVARLPSSADATIVSANGDNMRIRLSDISTHGCCVCGSVEGLRNGSFISLRLGQEAPLQGIVRWVRDQAAGIEFLRPLTRKQPEWLARTVEEGFL